MIKLLFVDDEKGITEVLNSFFKSRGFATYTANSGEEAIDVVKKEEPDIVFLDVKMPGIGGIEVLQEIKRFNNKINVIMLTVIDDKNTINSIMKQGANDCITKPFHVNYLEKVVIAKIQELIKEKNG